MQALLQSEDPIWNVKDAGTTMRFLTAFAAATQKDRILTGTARMQERPIRILVDALHQLGAQIEYLKEVGYPPIHIRMQGQALQGGKVSIRGDVSSQYISALLMIAPTLAGGLTVEITHSIGSRPYIEMTLELMAHFGIQYEWVGNHIHIPPQAYQANSYAIEADWSAASYWFSIAAIAQEAEIELLGLKLQSWQGDQRILALIKAFGLQASPSPSGFIIQKIKGFVPQKKILAIDFSHIPDLAQTFAVMALAKGIPLYMTGLESLRIKETDRIAALQNELAKFGGSMKAYEKGFLVSGHFQPSTQPIATYHDHRMAMSFAPLAILQPYLDIKHPQVVQKSYPDFWQHLSMLST